MALERKGVFLVFFFFYCFDMFCFGTVMIGCPYANYSLPFKGLFSIFSGCLPGPYVDNPNVEVSTQPRALNLVLV